MDVKIQFVLGQEAHTDQRVNPVGQAEGDHHDTLKEWRVNDPAEVALILEAAEIANAKVVEASLAQFEAWREAGILDEILAAVSIFEGEDCTDAKFAGILTRVYEND